MSFIPPVSPAEVVQLYDEAERAIKHLERRLSKTLTFPSVNQLRYAGKHLTRFISNGQAVEQLNDAAKHCRRAIYDCHEVEIIYLSEYFDKFMDDYRTMVVGEIVKDFSVITGNFDKALAFIRDVNEDDRERYYIECRTHVEVLHGAVGVLKASRHDLNAALARNRRNFFFQAVAALSAIAAVAGVVFKYLLIS